MSLRLRPRAFLAFVFDCIGPLDHPTPSKRVLKVHQTSCMLNRRLLNSSPVEESPTLLRVHGLDLHLGGFGLVPR